MCLMVNRINVLDQVKALEQAGACGVTIHGRTMEQRYKKAANWDLIGEAASLVNIPVTGARSNRWLEE